MQTLCFGTGDEDYKKMSKFWGKLFLINFTIGVVTGIVQELQFGMNWSEYSRYVGDIFGAPLAIEVLLVIVAPIFLPIVLAYQLWTYKAFGKRVGTDPNELEY